MYITLISCTRSVHYNTRKSQIEFQLAISPNTFYLPALPTTPLVQHFERCQREKHLLLWVIRLGDLQIVEEPQHYNRKGMRVFYCAKCNNRAYDCCSRCDEQWYCSEKCHIADWPSHKKNCESKKDR